MASGATPLWPGVAAVAAATCARLARLRRRLSWSSDGFFNPEGGPLDPDDKVGGRGRFPLLMNSFLHRVPRGEGGPLLKQRKFKYDRTLPETIPGWKRAYRMPLPPNVNDIVIPTWPVLMEAVKNCEAEDAVIPMWQRKPELGMFSPTPRWTGKMRPFAKGKWEKSTFWRKKMKEYYHRQRMRQASSQLTFSKYLPESMDRLELAGSQLVPGAAQGALKMEKETWKALRKLSPDQLVKAMNDQKYIRLGNAAQTKALNWRPMHQVKAFKMLREVLKRIDVVIDVRDARLPFTSAHPDVPGWARGKPRVIVLMKRDLVPAQALEESMRAIPLSEQDRGMPVIAVDGMNKGHEGLEELRTELMRSGAFVNRRRQRKGINPRAIRVITLGMPNIGKSTLINRLVGRKVAPKSGEAGSTKKLTWHKIGGFRNTELEFLDAPGLIPYQFGKRFSEKQALMLCMIKCFGRRILDREKTAFELVHHLGRLSKEKPHLVDRRIWQYAEEEYEVDFQAALRREAPFLPKHVSGTSGEGWCGKLLADFNRGYWGNIQLESHPEAARLQRDFAAFGMDDPADANSTALALPENSTALPAPRQVYDLLTIVPKASDELKNPVPPRASMEKVPVPVRVRGQEEEEGLFEGW